MLNKNNSKKLLALTVLLLMSSANVKASQVDFTGNATKVEETSNGAELWTQGHKTQHNFFLIPIIAKIAIIAAKASAVAAKAAAAATKVIAAKTGIAAAKIKAAAAATKKVVTAVNNVHNVVQKVVDQTKPTAAGIATIVPAKLDLNNRDGYSDEEILKFVSDAGASPEAAAELQAANAELKSAAKEDASESQEYEEALEDAKLSSNAMWTELETAVDGNREPNFSNLESGFTAQAKAAADTKKATAKGTVTSKKVDLASQTRAETLEEQAGTSLDATIAAENAISDDWEAIATAKEQNQPVDAAVQKLTADATTAANEAQKDEENQKALEADPGFVQTWTSADELEDLGAGDFGAGAPAAG
jgi:chromosome segregation ATPase